MNRDATRTRRIILLTVFLVATAVLFYLRHNNQAPVGQSKPSNEISVQVQPSCKLEPSVYESHDLVEIAYSWLVLEQFRRPLKQYKIRVQMIDEQGRPRITDDHYPPSSIMDWEPGAIITYKRLVYIPPFEEEVKLTIEIGLFDEYKPDKVILIPDELTSARLVKTATLHVAPPPDLNAKLAETAFTFADGWYPLESDPLKRRTWRWMSDRGIISLPNLGTDAILYLNLYIPRHPFEEPSNVTISFNHKVLEEYTASVDQLSKRYRISVADFEGADSGSLLFETDQTYIPRKLGLSSDDRELGLMVVTVYYRKQAQVRQELMLSRPQ